MRYLIIILSMLFSLNAAQAQSIRVLCAGQKTSLRGLSVVDDKVVWVSGSNGTVGRSVDGGTTFTWLTVKGFEKTDFRDIEAWDDKTAVIMGIAEPAYILKTTDGGNSWTTVYENKTKGMFMDAMDFSADGKHGMVVGDAINGKIFLAATSNGGDSWEIADLPTAKADSAEGCFASSGTNIRLLGVATPFIVTGGLHSNLVTSTSKIALPIIQGKETTGANSIAIKDKNIFIVAGGDFNTKDSTTDNCFVTNDGGRSWKKPVEGPHGYRSCVEWLSGKDWISCGLNGVDLSNDEGMHWKSIGQEGFHVCRKAKKGTVVFLAGGNGKVGKME